MANASLKALLTGLIFFAGCATPPGTHFWYADTTITARRVAEVLRQNPLAAGQNIRVVTLGSSVAVSHHIVQIRHGEELHIHRNHDLTVYVVKGHGTMRVGGEVFTLRQGDALVIPRGVPHAFTNSGRLPALAFVSFSPGFDGKDSTATLGR